MKSWLSLFAVAALTAGAALWTVSAYDAYGATILLTYAETALSNCF